MVFTTSKAGAAGRKHVSLKMTHCPISSGSVHPTGSVLLGLGLDRVYLLANKQAGVRPASSRGDFLTVSHIPTILVEEGTGDGPH